MVGKLVVEMKMNATWRCEHNSVDIQIIILRWLEKANEKIIFCHTSIHKLRAHRFPNGYCLCGFIPGSRLTSTHSPFQRLDFVRSVNNNPRIDGVDDSIN